MCVKLDDWQGSSVRALTTDLPFPDRALFFFHHRVFYPVSTRGFSTEVNRPGRDANYTLPETKLGLEVFYIYGRLRVMVSITTFYLYFIRMNCKDNRSGKGPHHASGCWSPASHRGCPVSFLDCVPYEVSSVWNKGTGFSSNIRVSPVSVISPMFGTHLRLNIDVIWYDIFNCNWVDTRWQQHSTHLHTNNTWTTQWTQNNT